MLEDQWGTEAFPIPGLTERKGGNLSCRLPDRLYHQHLRAAFGNEQEDVEGDSGGGDRISGYFKIPLRRMDGIPGLVCRRTAVLSESGIGEDPDGLQEYEGGE